MKLNKFAVSAENTAIIHNDQQYNLSNGFSFVGLEYDVINQELNLKWIKGFGGGADGLPDELMIEFTGVNFLKTQQRDIAQPYPRDEFVTAMGFAPNEKISEFGSPYQDAGNDTHQHLGFEFGSGLAIKFSAANANLKTVTKF